MPKLELFFYITIPLLILGIPLHYSVFPLCLAMLVIRCVTSERTTVASFLMLYAGPTIGCIRSIYPFLPVYGAMFSLLGFIMVFREYNGFFYKNRSGIFALLLVFAYFYCTLVYGGYNEEGVDKFSGIISNGITSLLGFYVLFTSRKIQNSQFAQMLIITSVMMIEYLLTFYHFSAGGIFDFNWLRETATYIEETQLDHKIIGYQHIGMNTAFALGIFMAKRKLETKETIYFCIVCFWLALMSGARQSVLAVAAIIAVRYILLGNTGEAKLKIKYVILISVLLYIVYNLAYWLNIEAITKTFEEGDTGRDLLKIQALLIFEREPFFGQGLGGFMVITGEDYPHNFFLEILCECGLVGMIFLAGVCLIYMMKNKIGIRQQTGNNSFFIIMMIALTVRCMVSGNFTLSIQLFSALFALSSLSYIKKSI